MRKRLVIVGGVAAGASAAAKARRANEDIDIVMFESGPYMSFANCGLPYYIGGEISNRKHLFVVNPHTFTSRYRVDVRLNSTVTEVLPASREVIFTGPDGDEGKMTYDRLILATGTMPVRLPLPGIDAPNIFECRTIPDVDAIIQNIDRIIPGEQGIRALIIGAGFIGLECAEQLMRRGIKVTIVEALDQIMSPFDKEMTFFLQHALEKEGAEVILNDLVTGFETSNGNSVASLKSERKLDFDLALVGVGVRPRIELAKAAGVVLGETGAIAVDAQQRTSDECIFAAGDNCESVFLPTGTKVNIPLAGPANKQGRVAGQNAALDLLEMAADNSARLKLPGVLGTSIVRACGIVVGGTGLTEKAAKKVGTDVRVAYNIGSDHAGYYPGATSIQVKLVYSPEDGRLLGAQAVGRNGIDKRIDICATAISAGMSIEDLEQLDLCYAPPFGSAKDVIILSGMVAANTFRDISPSITPEVLFEELRGEGPPFLVDVRTAREYKLGHLPTAKNIPLEELRDRLQEVPKDRPVVTQCNVGYRSYVAQQILRHHGYTQVRNLSGGYALAGLIQMHLADKGEMDG